MRYNFFLFLASCMSQKAEKPVLSGQRIKTRKRDEREKYDPTGFRDAVIQGLDKAGNDLEAVSKFLDTAGSKLDYRRYGEALFDILIAGGLLGMFSSTILYISNKSNVGKSFNPNHLSIYFFFFSSGWLHSH